METITRDANAKACEHPIGPGMTPGNLKTISTLRSELDTAQKDVMAKSIIIGSWTSQYAELEAERDSLRSELTTLRADKERLDWLERHWEFFPKQEGCRQSIPDQGILTWVSQSCERTLRAAIDDARAAQPRKEGEA